MGHQASRRLFENLEFFYSPEKLVAVQRPNYLTNNKKEKEQKQMLMPK